MSNGSLKTFLTFEETEQSRIFPSEAFGYWKVTVERPLRLSVDLSFAAPARFKAVCVEAKEELLAAFADGLAADPLHGRFETQEGGRRCVVEYEPDPDLGDTEQVPLLEEGGVDAFVRREVLPHVPDAWVDEAATRVGYEISFSRYFYKPKPLRTLEEIRADILAVRKETEGLLDRILGVDPGGA